MKLSVVIPTLNGAANIGALLKLILGMPGVWEVVVAEGGSTGGTLYLIRPPRGVAAQIVGAMGAGYIGGNFRLRYPGGGALGRWLETLAPVYRSLGRSYGDSGLFVRRDVYEACWGFPHI